jgi:hypothetical protein
MAEARPTTTYEALDEDRRIPFSAADERAITGLTVWCRIVGVINIIIALGTATLTLLPMIRAGIFSLLVVLIVVLRDGALLLLGLFLLQAAKPLRKMATTDVADKQYLVAGTMALTKYFNLTGVLMVLTVALLALTLFGMLLPKFM